MRILTWNVNSLGTLRQYHPWCDLDGPKDILDRLDADMVCMQETKVTRDKLDPAWALVDGYDAFFAFCKTRKGYAKFSG